MYGKCVLWKSIKAKRLVVKVKTKLGVVVKLVTMWPTRTQLGYVYGRFMAVRSIAAVTNITDVGTV